MCLRKGDGSGYGPTKGFRLIATTLDPKTLQLMLPGTWPPPCRWRRPTLHRFMSSTRCGVGLNTTLNQRSMNCGGPIFKSAPNGRLCATGNWCCWPPPSACSWVPCPRSPSSQDPPRRRCPLLHQKRRQGKNQWYHRRSPTASGPGSGSSGPPRCGGSAGGSAPGHGCSGTGHVVRAAPHVPNWPRSLPTSPVPFRLTPHLPPPGQPATNTLLGSPGPRLPDARRGRPAPSITSIHVAPLPFLVKSTYSQTFLAGTNEPSRKAIDQASVPSWSNAAKVSSIRRGVRLSVAS